MKSGPDIAMIASLVGDPARANMLTALMTGRALTASELAHQAGVMPQTASSHLAKLEAGGLIEPEKQGRIAITAWRTPVSPAYLKGFRASPRAPGTCGCAPGQRDRRCAARGFATTIWP